MKSKLVHWLSAPLALLTLALTLAACNTMGGVGEDVESAGRGINKSAEANKGY